jgi:hypothetical protein
MRIRQIRATVQHLGDAARALDYEPDRDAPLEARVRAEPVFVAATEAVELLPDDALDDLLREPTIRLSGSRATRYGGEQRGESNRKRRRRMEKLRFQAARLSTCR